MLLQNHQVASFSQSVPRCWVSLHHLFFVPGQTKNSRWKGITYAVFQEKHGENKKTVGPRDNFSIPPKSTAATVVSSGASKSCQHREHPFFVGGRLMVKFYNFLGFGGKTLIVGACCSKPHQNWYAFNMGSCPQIDVWILLLLLLLPPPSVRISLQNYALYNAGFTWSTNVIECPAAWQEQRAWWLWSSGAGFQPSNQQ